MKATRKCSFCGKSFVSKRGNTGEKVDKVNQNVFANDGAKADTLRNAYKKTYKPTGSSSGSLTKNNKKTKVANNQNNKKEGDDDGDTDAKVEVKNVLYGMNQGFIGVNFSAEVKIPGYTDSMPNIEGTLEVNTVNDWSMGVEGSASFLKSITLEIKLGIPSICAISSFFFTDLIRKPRPFRGDFVM